MEQMRERVARIINPYAFKSWQGMYDYCLPDEGEENARLYADMTHKADCDEALRKATEIEALMQPEIDRRVAEEKARLLAGLREPSEAMRQAVMDCGPIGCCIIHDYEAKGILYAVADQIKADAD